ncbi:PCI-domain-containing protein [Metschnikowia bicuspidata]|uniref:PCI-domain-containing protein n=1 Tax=Metschnikowia bicuspidata TaxID=27322 RepID=A0A4P9ZIK9_9ASCO|nr:PCI-domain-containing protein [Metschnikowia bicuspidata]
MSFAEIIEEARVAESQKRYHDAETKYYSVINLHFARDDQLQKTKFLQGQETAILGLGKVLQTQKDADKLKALIENSRLVLGLFAKSKTAKVVKTLVEYFDAIPNSLDAQISAIRESIDWAVESKLSFLRQQLQLKLSAKLYDAGLYQEGLKIITGLLREYKKLDDKSSLLEVQLVESQIYHALRNIPKSKAALTSARTSANSIFCPTLLQAELDCQSGILNAEDKDYKTAYSYFYESFEGYNSQNDSRAIVVLKYMLLTKIMLNLIDDVNVLLSNKNVVKYQSREIDAMRAIATAYAKRSLKEFEAALLKYATELRSDPIIKNHFNALYDNLLEQNLLKIIESYNVVELSYISKTIGLNTQQVEGKLSQMILDKVFHGVLDQGNGWLIIYDQPRKDASYEAALDLVKNMSSVVDLLYEKASALN